MSRAFRATLEEVLEADLILHVRDISHPETERQAADVAEILAGLGVRPETPQFEVWNKLDLVDPPAREALAVQATRSETIFALSALTGEGLARLTDAISAAFAEDVTERDLRLGFADGRKRAWLHAEGVVTAERETRTGHRVSVRWTARQEKRYRAL